MTRRSGSASFFIIKKNDTCGESAHGPYTVLDAHAIKTDDEWHLFGIHLGVRPGEPNTDLSG